MARKSKQSRIDELEELLREADPYGWVGKRDANAALQWYDKVLETLKGGKDSGKE